MSELLNTAILWDIENVIPPTGTSYIQSIIETIEEEGKISYAMAFGNWNRNNIKNIAGELAANSFELIHVPKSRKDSSDMTMVAHGVELIFQYPHIDRYVLITGDADFRPLLLSLRKYGKQTLIICDARNASEDLLKMADDYKDYREITDDDDDDGRSEETDAKPAGNGQLSRRQAFELLEEAVRNMLKEKNRDAVGIGAVKIRMKLMNSSFNEKKLGYRMWKHFINDAVEQTAVRYASESDNTAVTLDISACTDHLPEAFTALLDILPEGGDEWMRFDEAAKKLDYKSLGYSKFKKLAIDAEKRGLITTRHKGLIWHLKRT